MSVSSPFIHQGKGGVRSQALSPIYVRSYSDVVVLLIHLHRPDRYSFYHCNSHSPHFLPHSMWSLLGKINPCAEKDPVVPEDPHIAVQDRLVRHAFYDRVEETDCSSGTDTIRLVERPLTKSSSKVATASASTPLLGGKSFQATKTSLVVFPSRDISGPAPGRAAFMTVQSEAPPSCSSDGKSRTHHNATIEQYFPMPDPHSESSDTQNKCPATQACSSTATAPRIYDCSRTEKMNVTMTANHLGPWLELKNTPGQHDGSMINGKYRVHEGKETYATDEGSMFFEGTKGWEGFTPWKNIDGPGRTLASFCGGH
jgi:hypothetical protein